MHFKSCAAGTSKDTLINVNMVWLASKQTVILDCVSITGSHGSPLSVRSFYMFIKGYEEKVLEK